MTEIIYIIDDDVRFIKMMVSYSQVMGLHPKTFTQAGEFFKEDFKNPKNSLIILDLNMPEMDGIEVMRKMVDLGISIPLVILSGFDQRVLHSAEQLARAHNLKIIATMKKPLKFIVFKNLINELKFTKDKQIVEYQTEFTLDELKFGIENNQLLILYQPQIEISNLKVTGVEVLTYWLHPDYGIISPNSFIPIAENYNLINDLTDNILLRAIQQARIWKQVNFNPQISINLSSQSITSLNLPDKLDEMLKQNDISPNQLILEITESVLMGELIKSLDILTRLRMKEINLSIDDFGTGYSSLSQLYRIPFTELKIDKSFVGKILIDEEAKGIVKMCINLGHELNMKVVAEGVENEETLDILKMMNCDIAQGYYFSKAIPSNKLIEWVEKFNSFSY